MEEICKVMDISMEGDNLHDVQNYGQELHESKATENGKRNQFEVIFTVTLTTLFCDKKLIKYNNSVKIVFYQMTLLIHIS